MDRRRNQEPALSIRKLFAVLALVVSIPLFAQADPAEALLAARNEAAAASAAEQAGSAALAREDAALQRAIDRKIDARMSAALAPPVKVRARSANVAARNSPRAKGSGRGLYAAQ